MGFALGGAWRESVRCSVADAYGLDGAGCRPSARGLVRRAGSISVRLCVGRSRPSQWRFRLVDFISFGTKWVVSRSLRRLAGRSAVAGMAGATFAVCEAENRRDFAQDGCLGWHIAGGAAVGRVRLRGFPKLRGFPSSILMTRGGLAWPAVQVDNYLSWMSRFLRSRDFEIIEQRNSALEYSYLV